MQSSENQMFAGRIEGSIRTVKAWEEDKDLFVICRNQLPWEELRNDHGPYSDLEKDRTLSRTARFAQRLARYFKQSMTWVNQPPCAACRGSNMQFVASRGAQTDEERQGEAARVEVYKCETCHSTTTFPRYNSVKKLLETKKGRCGEYANLFGFVCRSVGFETRYILDFTDHVWTEVRIGDDWMMVDSCEGVIDEPSMYEAGWGKELSYVIAIAVDHCLDVTPRYSRKLGSDEMIARRRQFTSNDSVSNQVIEQISKRLSSAMNQKGREELQSRLSMEQKNLVELNRKSEWEKRYSKGRISGSLEWKVSRSEAGSNDADGRAETRGAPSGLYLESFYPFTPELTIFLNPTPTTAHGAIVVSGAECAVGYSNSISVVILDENHLGCILQSRCFVRLSEFSTFVSSLPPGRIIVVHGSLSEKIGGSDISFTVPQVPTFNPFLLEEGLMFAGQIGCSPTWSFCWTFGDTPKGILLKTQGESTSYSELKLKVSKDTYPSSICGRLPEHIMPLQTQLIATAEQKRIAFDAFMEAREVSTCCGYTTRNGMPIYLLDSMAYPFQRFEGSRSDSWTSHFFLPSPLVTDEGNLSSERSEISSYEVPVDMAFFTSKLGYQLLKIQNGSQVSLPTTTVLRNSRLVALYFSAHWCGPCRSFTPLLAEMYDHLREAYPTHGLEIVFISSDRDQASFLAYYRSMPWCSLPYEALGSYKHALSMQYEVRGIPSLVVLDAVTGQTIVSASQSRSDVVKACSRGEQEIVSLFGKWLEMVPLETRELVSMLEFSCVDAAASTSNHSEIQNPYLIRSEHLPSLDSTKPIAADLVDEVKDPSFRKRSVDDCVQTLLGLSGGKRGLEEVLSTALRYLENAKRQPWNPKYRVFKLHNKVADGITKLHGGVPLLLAFDFEIASTLSDYIARIPLENDLILMYERIETIKMKYC